MATLLAAVMVSMAAGYARAQQQPLLLPSAVAYDAAGDLFFVDTNRNQVFEVSLAGALTTVAGTAVQGFGGDGGTATSAELNAPQGLAIGADGTIYVADTGNQRVRAIANGQISTFAGTGVAGFSGDNGPATAAMLSRPTALALDGHGNVLICDTANQRIRRVSAGTITTVGGTGVQGFAGDASTASSAEFDSPAGIAVASDGRIFVADTQNNRLRVIATDGTIQTFAGTGAAGYAGDGGPATAASLDLPHGITLDAAGDVLFADSNNQRIRVITPQGTISTIAGNGVQGFAADGIASTSGALNTPRGVAISSFFTPVFGDTPNQLVREIAANGEIYTIALAPVVRSSTVTLTAARSTVYGNESATVAVSGSAATPQGSVALQSGMATLANAVLSSGSATLSGLALPAGTYSLTAAYSGDGLNPAASSVATSVTVSPAQVVASAAPVSITYGQAIPALSGTITGILPQDAALVSVAFSTTASLLDPVGSYPIAASMTGKGSSNYTLTTSPSSGALNIVQAQSTLTLQPLNQTFYAGQSVLLTASLGSATTGTPTGLVSFADAGTVVAQATAVNGIASVSYVPSTQGSHIITASYSGDKNFLGSISGTETTTVAALPDFTVTPSTTSQTVQGGLIATYGLNVASQSAPFTGSVTFSVAGLPSGVTASFSPTAVVPGSIGATVILSVQTIALARLSSPRALHRNDPLLLCLCLPLVMRRKRRGSRQCLGSCCLVLLSIALASTFGCGDRTVSTSVTQSQSSTLTITATGTNLAGAIVAHTATVALTVQ